METIANKIVNYLEKDNAIWSELDRMRMILGVQVLVHNIVMILVILFAAQMVGAFLEAAVLLTANGILKMEVGGLHFKKSSACTAGTGIFVTAGVMLSRQMNMELIHIMIVYFACLAVIMIVGPQGTKNNPFSKESCKKMKKKAVVIVLAYMAMTFFMKEYGNQISYLLLIAVVFETFSLLPLYIKNKSEKCDAYYVRDVEI